MKDELGDKKILFICDNPPHWLHESYAKSINADFFVYPTKDHKESLKTIVKIPKDYDIYLTEGFFNYISLLKAIGCLKKHVIIINIFSDPRLFQLYTDKKFNIKKAELQKYPFIQKQIVKRNLKKLDGAICISELSSWLFRKFNKKNHILVIPAFVSDKRYMTLQKNIPRLSSHNILFIGHGPDWHYKGIDLMINSFIKIKKLFPDAKLFILGEWIIKEEWLSDGVFFEGFQDIKPYLKKCSLSLHLGRGEGFGINVLETMLSGIPTIVSNYTGAEQAIRKVGEELVTPLNEKIIVDRVLGYFNSNIKKKKLLSKKSRSVAREFQKNKILKIFRKKFNKLIIDIERERK
ncbi:glycosyltransferase [Candidatus Pacearchaeota archaeon]|nr:glycosyltransferase [Candidatus Pacearchaeota archaeon]